MAKNKKNAGKNHKNILPSGFRLRIHSAHEKDKNRSGEQGEKSHISMFSLSVHSPDLLFDQLYQKKLQKKLHYPQEYHPRKGLIRPIPRAVRRYAVTISTFTIRMTKKLT